jgi:hypothetical protein
MFFLLFVGFFYDFGVFYILFVYLGEQTLIAAVSFAEVDALNEFYQEEEYQDDAQEGVDDILDKVWLKQE